MIFLPILWDVDTVTNPILQMRNWSSESSVKLSKCHTACMWWYQPKAEPWFELGLSSVNLEPGTGGKGMENTAFSGPRTEGERFMWFSHSVMSNFLQSHELQSHEANSGGSSVLHCLLANEWLVAVQSCLTLCNPMDVACQAPLSMEFSGQEYWSGITEMPIKTTMRYHFTLVRMAIKKKSTNNKCWRGVEKREHFCTVGRNVNWYSHYGRRYGDSLKN